MVILNECISGHIEDLTDPPPHVSTVTMATVPLNEGTQDHKPALLYFLLSPYIKRENKTGDREA
jgi:hypothetical protein